MDWRYVWLKVGIRLAIWALIVGPTAAFLLFGPRIESGTKLVVVLIASFVGNLLAEAVWTRLGIVSRSDAAPNPNAGRSNGERPNG